MPTLGTIVGLIGVSAMGAFLDILGLTIERSNAIAPSAIIIGAVVNIPIVYSIGVVIAVIGVILWVLGAVGREVGDRRHYW